MGSVIKSLKKLYKKMGGTNTKGINTVDGMVDKIAEKYEAGGGSDSTGGKNVFVHLVDNENNDYTQRRLDKTYRELHDIWMGRNIIYIVNDSGSYLRYCMITDFTYDTDDNYFQISSGALGWNFLSSDSPDDYPLEDMD